MKVYCNHCDTSREATIFDDLTCCGVIGGCTIFSYSFDEFCQAYQELCAHLPNIRETRDALCKATFLLPLNSGSMLFTDELRDDLTAMLLFNEQVCLAGQYVLQNKSDEFFYSLTKNNLVSLVKLMPYHELDSCDEDLLLSVEKNDELLTVFRNLQRMIRVTNYDKLNFGLLIPGWAAIQADSMATQGALALLTRCDIVGLDNYNGITQTRKEDAARFGLTEADLMKESGLTNLALGQASRPRFNQEYEFLKELGLRVPVGMSFDDLMLLRQESSAKALRTVFNDIKSRGLSERRQQIRNIRAKIVRFNREAEESFQTKTFFLSGLLSTLGGIIGGLPGAAVGGVGSSVALYLASRSRRSLMWMRVLHKYLQGANNRMNSD